MAVDSRGTNLLVGEAKVDMTGKLYHAIKVTVDVVSSLAHDFVVDLAVAGDKADGFLTDENTINKGVSFDATGWRRIGVAGEAIGTPGIELAVNASGRLIAVANASTGDSIVGTSLTIASGDGSRFSFLEQHGRGTV